MASLRLASVCLSVLPILEGHAASCDGPSFTFRSWEDDGALDGCRTYNGDIMVDEGASTVIRLNELQNITGSLLITHATQFVKLEVRSLSVIGGDLKLFALPYFTTLDLSALQQVNDIEMSLLPSLTQGIGFQSAFAANAVYINNTGLTVLSLPVASTKEQVDIRENNFLRSLDLSRLKDAKGITVILNSGGLDLDLGSLETGSDMSLNQIVSLNTPNLRDLHGGVYVEGIFSLDACPLTNLSLPKLTKSGSLSLTGNPNLLYVNVPFLEQTTYTGVNFALNPNLKSIELPKLRFVEGEGTYPNGGSYMALEGNFTKISMPALEQIDGNVWITTTYDAPSVCDDTNKAWKDGKIVGLYNCTIGTLDPSGSTPAHPTPSTQSSGWSRHWSSGAIAGVAVAGAVKHRPKRTETGDNVQHSLGGTRAQKAVAPPSYATVLEDDHIRRVPHAEDRLREVSKEKTIPSSQHSGDLHLDDEQATEVRGEMV